MFCCVFNGTSKICGVEGLDRQIDKIETPREWIGRQYFDDVMRKYYWKTLSAKYTAVYDETYSYREL